MLLPLIDKRMTLVVGLLFAIVAIVNAKDVCDDHLSQIKMIPFEGNVGVDQHGQ